MRDDSRNSGDSSAAPDAERAAVEMQLRILRGLTGAQRLQIALEMSDLAREFSRAGLRARHPDWTDAEVTRELVRYAFLPDPMPDGFS